MRPLGVSTSRLRCADPYDSRTLGRPGINTPWAEKIPRPAGVLCGRYRTRTDDLFRVKEARYQLRQSPAPVNLATPRAPLRATFALRTSRSRHTPRSVWRPGIGSVRVVEAAVRAAVKCGCGAVVAHHLAKVRVASSNLVIRSSGTSFEIHVRWSGREARQRPAKPYTRVRIPSPPRPRTQVRRPGRLAQR